MNHNSVPTTCTATLITGWALLNINSKNEKDRVNARLGVVTNLINQGFHRDFAIIHAFTTKAQNCNDLMPHLGFDFCFEGPKTRKDFDRKFSKNGVEKIQREQNTGNLYLWATTPERYQEALTSYQKVLENRKEEIDPPKKPDPTRLIFPDLRRVDLIKGGFIQANTYMDNPINQTIMAKPVVMERFIKITFGIDVKSFFTAKGVDDWTTITVRRLKEAQLEWKNELV